MVRCRNLQLQNISRQQNSSHQPDPCRKVKKCSPCLFGKRMRQTSAAAAIRLFKALLWFCCTCTALRVPRYASQFIARLAAHTAFVTAAPVPFMPPHSFHPSFRYITPRSHPDHLLQDLVALSRQIAQTHGCTYLSAGPTLPYSLGFIPLHYVLHSF